jgi:hypothetical protein
MSTQRYCIPSVMLDGQIQDYSGFLEERRKLMSLKIKEWFNKL